MRLGVVIAVVLAWSACSSHEAPPAPGPPPKTSPPKTPPAVDAAPLGACDRDEDCEIYCPSAPGCCSEYLCGCDLAIATRDEAAIEKDFEATCQHTDCKVADCGPPRLVHAACVAHRCDAVPDPPPDARAR
jgi:hypothetical protein